MNTKGQNKNLPKKRCKINQNFANHQQLAPKTRKNALYGPFSSKHISTWLNVACFYGDASKSRFDNKC